MSLEIFVSSKFNRVLKCSIVKKARKRKSKDEEIQTSNQSIHINLALVSVIEHNSKAEVSQPSLAPTKAE